MTYVYDVLLNFTDNYYYDFYEWDSKDNIVNIKKIPLFHINKNTLNDLINFRIKIDKSFLDIIENKSISLKKYKDKYVYLALFSSGEKSIGICFDRKGMVMYKSAMLLDEETEINDIALNQKIVTIKYNKYDSNAINILRSDLQDRKQIINKIKNIYNNHEYSKLKYVYYEIFDEKKDDCDIIYHELLDKIDEKIIDYHFLLE